MNDERSRGLEALSDALLSVTAERSVESILQKLVHAARELAGARYAALGVPDGEGGFAQFITSGMSEKLIAAMGPLPRTHGLLGLMLESEEPYRAPDIHAHPRFQGWWPRAHPDMRSFLGVPIVARTGVIGAFYLTEKEGRPEFDDGDERLIVLLAAHAAITIENARLYERSRELSIVEERNRLARELHDSVSQKLFGLVLSAESATTLVDGDPGKPGRSWSASACSRRRPRRSCARSSSSCGRPHWRARGSPRRCASTSTCSSASTGGRSPSRWRARHAASRSWSARSSGSRRRRFENALRHADAKELRLRLAATDGRVELTVSDDGVGFDPTAPAVRSRRLGLTSMEERAQALGGTLTIESEPGRGTTVRLEVAP